MKLKEKILSIFFSKINIDFFSRLVKKNKWLSPPYKIASQKLIDFKFPRHIFVETTSICNLKCKMCPRTITPVRPGTMDDKLFKKIIDEAKNYGHRSFCLHLFGEPLLDPKIIERLKYIKEANPKNSILLTTNAVLLNENIAKNLIENQVDKIAISIHSPESETYKNITGLDYLERVEKNIKNLIKLKNEVGSLKPKIALRIIRMEDNDSEIKEFRKKWSGYPVALEIRDEHNYGGKIENNPLKLTPAKRYPCYHLWFTLGINWDGEVTICCDDPQREAIIGNVKNSTLAQIWQSDILKNYRQYHLKGDYDKIPLCENCDVWDIYPDIFFERQKK